MKVNLKLVKIGMNMSEATITTWHKQPGDRFEKGEFLYAMETEKAVQDVEAPARGVLLNILVPAGKNVDVGSPVCAVDLEDEK